MCQNPSRHCAYEGVSVCVDGGKSFKKRMRIIPQVEFDGVEASIDRLCMDVHVFLYLCQDQKLMDQSWRCRNPAMVIGGWAKSSSSSSLFLFCFVLFFVLFLRHARKPTPNALKTMKTHPLRGQVELLWMRHTAT